MNKIVKYGELKKGDVVQFHGALVKIINVVVSGFCDNEYHKGERIINFEIEPYNDEAERILGSFYSHGCYGGVESLTLVKEG